MPHIRDNFSSTARRPVNLFARTQLQRWLASRKMVLRAETAAVLVRIHEFARLIELEGFERAMLKITGADEIEGINSLTARITDALCRETRGMEREILRKSLHEMLLYSTGVEIEVSVAVFGTKIERFLHQRGSKGLLRLFLSLHLFNEVWIKIQQRLQTSAPDGESFLAAMYWFEWTCRSAVDLAIGGWSKWPKLGRTLAKSLIDAVEFQVSNMRRPSAA